MDRRELLQEVEKLLAALEEARQRVAPDIDGGSELGQGLRDATRNVGDSSSGSWIGWHSRMYYGDYEEPSVAESWDPEWGGIHGFSERWRERAQAEVQQAIEHRAGTTLGELAAVADRVREACQPLQQEVLTVLSPVCDLAGLAKEGEQLAKLEDIEWIVPPAKFVRAIAPGQMMSRDTVAIGQGLQAPLHLNVEGAIVSNTSTLAKSRDFLTDATRLARQVRTKLQATPARERVEAAAAGEPSDERLARQLRQRSIALFILLAVVITAGVIILLRSLIDNRLATAVIIVAAALLVAGIYAFLVDRGHARRALAAAVGVGGAITLVDQLLSYFE
jgi:hypothetical protein